MQVDAVALEPDANEINPVGGNVSIVRLVRGSRQTKSTQSERDHRSPSCHSLALFWKPKNRTFALFESHAGCEAKRCVNHFSERQQRAREFGEKAVNQNREMAAGIEAAGDSLKYARDRRVSQERPRNAKSRRLSPSALGVDWSGGSGIA